jgi:hypothetical protein
MHSVRMVEFQPVSGMSALWFELSLISDARSIAPNELIRPFIEDFVAKGYNNSEIVSRLRKHYDTNMYNVSWVSRWLLSRASIWYMVWLQDRPTEKAALSVGTEVGSWTSTHDHKYRTSYRASAGTLPNAGFTRYEADSSAWRENRCPKVCALRLPVVIFCVLV